MVRLSPEVVDGSMSTVVVELLLTRTVMSQSWEADEVVLGKEGTSDQDAVAPPELVGLFSVDELDIQQKVGVLLITQVVTDNAPPGTGNEFVTYGGREGAVGPAIALRMVSVIHHAAFWLTLVSSV